jgi:hypothetical protein
MKFGVARCPHCGDLSLVSLRKRRHRCFGCWRFFDLKPDRIVARARTIKEIWTIYRGMKG